MSGWYWRDGTLALPLGVHPEDPVWIETMRAIEEKLCDLDYRIIKQETLDTGYWLSTVWLGIDQRMLGGEGPPIIFETAVFSNDTGDGHGDILDMERYSSEEGARLGHEIMKAMWSYSGLHVSEIGKWPEEEK